MDLQTYSQHDTKQERSWWNKDKLILLIAWVIQSTNDTYISLIAENRWKSVANDYALHKTEQRAISLLDNLTVYKFLLWQARH